MHNGAVELVLQCTANDDGKLALLINEADPINDTGEDYNSNGPGASGVEVQQELPSGMVRPSTGGV